MYIETELFFPFVYLPSKLCSQLASARYLVFIDDVQQAEVLKDIIDSQFPKNAKSGMVIVTTSVRQVAEVRSHGSYVHTMKCLDDTRSQELLFSTMDANRVSKQVRQGSKGIITKCGGLPLALTSVARHMSIQPRRLDKDFCVAVGKQLGSKYLSGIKGEAQFKELKRALEQCFEALPNNDHKTYMLSLGMFPRNDPIRCKSLARRLKAEELLDNVDGDGKECLDELVNHCIVEPVQISSCSQDLKRCRVNVGIMLEFIIQKSWSTNFVNVIREEDELRDPRRRIRRLSVQSSKSCDEIKALAGKYSMSGTIRSLTIVPPVGRSELDPSERISELSDDIKSCKFLRLLDLEGCDGINEAFFRGICELVYLRYLSLRKTDVKNIPVEIRNLQCLQTLDVRGTKDIVLLVKEVITLPDLAFLFGKFELPEMSEETKKFLSTKSKLQTIAEIVVNQQGNNPKEIIREAKNLRKVKVCYIGTRSVQDIGRGKEIRPGRFRFARRIFRTLCTCGRPCASGSHPASSQSSVSPSQQTSNNGLVEALQSRCTSLNSVSIESNDLSNDITAYLLAGPCKIDRMKLSGKLCGLPVESTLKLIGTLNKLQLSNTGLTIDELSILENISSLEYLKLKDDQEGSWGGTFSLHENGFESLRRLCFEASKLPKLEFHPGSMKRLTSLHLLCLDICQMQIVKEITESIRNITSLNEVILHHSASATEGMVEAWKIAAKSNPNRPCVTTSTCW
jgi:disease resistance protein RPM1